MIFVWYHADNQKPAYTITMLDEIEQKGMYMVGDFEVPDWHCHIMEFAQNSTDWYIYIPRPRTIAHELSLNHTHSLELNRLVYHPVLPSMHYSAH
jgi:hypothetical protein